MKTARLVVIALALSLVAAPVFASISESNNDSTAFHALGALPISEQAPTALDDQELAAVEGGSHLTSLSAALTATLTLIAANPGLYGGVGQLGNVITSFALLNAIITPFHSCTGGVGTAVPC